MKVRIKRSFKSHTYSLARIANVPKRNISDFRAPKTHFGSWDAWCCKKKASAGTRLGSPKIQQNWSHFQQLNPWVNPLVEELLCCRNGSERVKEKKWDEEDAVINSLLVKWLFPSLLLI